MVIALRAIELFKGSGRASHDAHPGTSSWPRRRFPNPPWPPTPAGAGFPHSSKASRQLLAGSQFDKIALEQCDSLQEHEYAPRNVWHRVPVLMHFGEFARARGASGWFQLPEHVDAFVAQWVADRSHSRQPRSRLEVDARNPIEQMLRLVLPKFESGRSHKRPEAFKKQAPHFFE